jgi:predicted ester cyclase
MSTEELKATIRRVWDETYNKGNVDALDEIYAANYVRHEPPLHKSETFEAFKQRQADTRSSYPDLQVTLHEIIIEGDISAFRATVSGTQTEPWPTTGEPPDGKHVTLPLCSVSRWAEGKIVEEWVMGDYLSFFLQRGYELVPPKGEAQG